MATTLKFKRTSAGYEAIGKTGTTYRIVDMSDVANRRLWNLFINGFCDDGYDTLRHAKADATHFENVCH